MSIVVECPWPMLEGQKVSTLLSKPIRFDVTEAVGPPTIFDVCPRSETLDIGRLISKLLHA